ncbi:hypothetical protein SAMN05421830_10630 [Desulfomicrobium norvegicum]|uniref:Uncharacterized protein n=1 Tax=Desulfomicrobium norvegicum (strain DSM 1741 / NCIMB 8310) TaxID=52561 RepID=A0A8G2F637_DESNO|nr:hypothetical protein SAMN05421830_10630 [Desulfomicrobium norvegicum]
MNMRWQEKISGVGRTNQNSGWMRRRHSRCGAYDPGMISVQNPNTRPRDNAIEPLRSGRIFRKIAENILEGPGIKDTLGPEVELFGRSRAQTFLDPNIQDILSETLGQLTLKKQQSTFLATFLASFLAAFLFSPVKQAFGKRHDRTLLG